MPSTVDRLAAAEQVSAALDAGDDVRNLSDGDYQRCRAEMIRRVTQKAWKQTDADDLARATARHTNTGN